MNELRWHPLQGEWVILSSKRKKRFKKSNPFSSDSPEMLGKSVPTIISNKYPNFSLDAEEPKPSDFYTKAKAYGTADIIIETFNETGDFDDYKVNEIYKIFIEIKNRMKELKKNNLLKYIYVFKNKGKEVGASLSHPHMQMYGMPFIPPIIAREIERSEDYYRLNGASIFDNIIDIEKNAKDRIVYQDQVFLSFVPFYARWPYECHILCKNNKQSLINMDDEELTSLSSHVQKIVKCYNSLLNHKMSYVMIFHQSPIHGSLNHYRFYVEFQPVYQSSNRLKHAAGIERIGNFELGIGRPSKQARLLRQGLDQEP